jgi:hypothetical protein
MRNLLIGLFLGAALTAGIGVSAGVRGPKFTGRSGPIPYNVVADGEIVCDNPWVQVENRTIECFSEPEREIPRDTLTAE